MVSSANIIESKIFDASLRNDKGLSIEPCGTPHTIFWKLVFKLLYFINCVRFVK